MFADDGSRRGRATDIFSLGCVFHEMNTSFLESPGLLKKLRLRVDAYVGNPCTILNSVGDIWHLSFVAPNRLIHHSSALAKLAFLMMDPSPCKRITARQLIALTSTARLDHCTRSSMSLLELIVIHLDTWATERKAPSLGMNRRFSGRISKSSGFENICGGTHGFPE